MGTAWKHPNFRFGWKTFERLVRKRLDGGRFGGVRSKVGYERVGAAGRPDAVWEKSVRASLGFLERHRASGFTWDVFETFRSILVRVTLPERDGGRTPRIMIDATSITLADYDGKLDETIPLPCPVRTRRPEARIADNVLEIRLRKRRAVGPTKRVRCAKKSPSG